jgi:phosphoglycolate phosphatase-like HAD superfamily hydrolase
VVIGDTPHDVDAALHHGAVAIGVATGRSSAAELREAGAHVVLTDLSDTAAVLAAVLG